jgi:hypothetical protein
LPSGTVRPSATARLLKRLRDAEARLADPTRCSSPGVFTILPAVTRADLDQVNARRPIIVWHYPRTSSSQFRRDGEARVNTDLVARMTAAAAVGLSGHFWEQDAARADRAAIATPDRLRPMSS